MEEDLVVSAFGLYKTEPALFVVARNHADHAGFMQARVVQQTVDLLNRISKRIRSVGVQVYTGERLSVAFGFPVVLFHLRTGSPAERRPGVNRQAKRQLLIIDFVWHDILW